MLRKVQTALTPFDEHIHKMTIKAYTKAQGQSKGLL